jgi:uncharacterized Zn-finger protein
MNTSTSSAGAHEVIAVRADQLPVFCPGPNAPLWSMHPRVYIDLGPQGQGQCPYCGAAYKLDGPAPAGH